MYEQQDDQLYNAIVNSSKFLCEYDGYTVYQQHEKFWTLDDTRIVLYMNFRINAVKRIYACVDFLTYWRDRTSGSHKVPKYLLFEYILKMYDFVLIGNATNTDMIGWWSHILDYSDENDIHLYLISDNGNSINPIKMDDIKELFYNYWKREIRDEYIALSRHKIF